MDQFMLVFPDVVQQLTELENDKHILKGVTDHFKKALEYNVPNGKKIRGLTAVMAYKDLVGEDRLTTENVRQAHLLGWCVELLQATILVADDMIDCSDIRRNAPCWYKMKEVGSLAVNDVQMLENACFMLLRRSFGRLPCYVDMFESLHEGAMITFIGQSLDFQMTKADVATFTKDKYRCLVDYKSSHFGVYTPIVLAMMLAGYEDAEVLRSIKETCLEMAYFYQVQNDFLDCFSDVLKKPGTDIEDGKCSWLAVTAMELGSDEQKNILRHFYGKNDPESISKVKQLYSDLELPNVYSRLEKNAYNDGKLQIDRRWSGKIRQALTNTLNRIHGRP